MKKEIILQDLQKRHPNEPEFLQAVQEVLTSVEDVYNEHPEFEKVRLMERLVEPDRILTFRVPWVDDHGDVHVNLGHRVQFNNAIGPYKGGIRFHPSVNLSILKFLGFEQTFKNALTTLPMGGAKGGSDFAPRGRSEAEIMRFCQAFMVELWRNLGPDQDVPAGDIGVGGREVGYMFGMYKKLSREHTGTFTGKGLEFGGSLLRPEATGFGALYFVRQMLADFDMDIAGKTIAVSGFGNVAWGAVTKAVEMGAKVVTLSGPDGYVYDPKGVSGDKIDYMLELRLSGEDIVAPYAERYPEATFFPGKKPWEQHVDIALPCATQNELNLADAQMLKDNGIKPRWVQVGNETSNGFLWTVRGDQWGDPVPDSLGRVTILESVGHLRNNPQQYAGLFAAGYDAVKSVFPKAEVIVHLDHGFDQALYDSNLDTLAKYGARWDMIGMSLYPYWALDSGLETDEEEAITHCIENINHVWEKYRTPVMLVETGFEVDESRPEVMEKGRDQLRRIIRESRATGHCRGIFYWEPECRPDRYKLGAFGSDGRPTAIMDGFDE